MYKVIMMCVLLMTTACGFTPLYRTDDKKTTDLTAAVEIHPIANVSGYQLQTELANQLNPDKRSVPKKYELSVWLNEPQISEQNIQDDNFASRERMILSAHYRLVDKQTHQAVVDTTTSATGAYNIAVEPYATYMAQKKVKTDLVKMLADRISIHVISFVKKEADSEG